MQGALDVGAVLEALGLGVTGDQWATFGIGVGLVLLVERLLPGGAPSLARARGGEA